MTRNISAMIGSVDDGLVRLLGWQPDQIVGSASTTFIHPDDQVSAVALWMDMLANPGSTRVWRGRYRTADGNWKWVEMVNVNHLDDPDLGYVHSSMSAVPASESSLEDELRQRKHMFSRLSEALPLGLFEIDSDRRIVTTNGRLHAIIGVPPCPTAKALFAHVAPKDRSLLDAALADALAGRDVDDCEIRFRNGSSAAAKSSPRVCCISLRPLSNDEGFVTGAIGILSDVTERVNLRRDLERRATVDDLTVCLNRKATLDLLFQTLSRRKPNEPGIAVAFVDLDHFKDVNDTHGHAIGDQLLCAAASRLQSAIRRQDRIGRIGGDEFLVICPNVESPARALDIANRLDRSLRGVVYLGPTQVTLDASIGVAWSTGHIEADALVAEADRAMYESKGSGRPMLRSGPPPARPERRSPDPEAAAHASNATAHVRA
jgi:diguanylate cyclase (GGDEF)-like protein/PAS domain S-box-containing protein